MKARIFLYRAGVYKTHSLPCKVVSVGNITLGGTGKTPFVALLAEMIRARGLRAVILSRGYGGKFQGPHGLVSDGERVLMNAHLAGDEPYLLAEKLTGTPVVIGKERRASGRWAAERFRAEVVLLDDGFQHLALRRDLNLLLIDSSCPFGNGKVFPRGVLREPLDQARRADAIILTKAGGGASIKNLEKEISDLAGGAPVFRVDYRPGAVRVLGAENLLPPEILRG
ncbi:MAG TPA: tetraacyldisaccharide 4'-kinase, partial [Syntrophales bacterium]